MHLVSGLNLLSSEQRQLPLGTTSIHVLDYVQEPQDCPFQRACMRAIQVALLLLMCMAWTTKDRASSTRSIANNRCCTNAVTM